MRIDSESGTRKQRGLHKRSGIDNGLVFGCWRRFALRVRYARAIADEHADRARGERDREARANG
jgi:hypothetical protein